MNIREMREYEKGYLLGKEDDLQEQGLRSILHEVRDAVGETVSARCVSIMKSAEMTDNVACGET